MRAILTRVCPYFIARRGQSPFPHEIFFCQLKRKFVNLLPHLFCEKRAKYFARSLNFILREAKRRFCLSAPDLPQGTCGKSECGDFNNKRAVTDRRREKTGGQPAQRACPQVFSKTQAKALVSFERFCAKKILLEKVKITFLTFSPYVRAQAGKVNAARVLWCALKKRAAEENSVRRAAKKRRTQGFS